MHNLSNKDKVENNTAFDLIYVGFTIQCLLKREMILRCPGEPKHTWNMLKISKDKPHAITKREGTDAMESISIIA